MGNFEPADTIPSDEPGEGGLAYNLPPEKQNEGSDSEMEYGTVLNFPGAASTSLAYNFHGFPISGMNMVVSDAISLDRSVRDTRDPECKHWDYPTDLPKASVILVFHNEGFSVLMR
jgi:polypeptide N-acetylgalactosaminyltransferase